MLQAQQCKQQACHVLKFVCRLICPVSPASRPLGRMGVSVSRGAVRGKEGSSLPQSTDVSDEPH